MTKDFAFRIGLTIITVLIAVTLLLDYQFSGPVEAAPALAPTPVAGINVASDLPKVLRFVEATAITVDTRYCQPAAQGDFIDLQWIIDQGASVNTTTVTLDYSNISGTYETGPTVVSANAADANDLAQYALFGANACVYFNVTNSNPVTVTAVGVAK